MTGCEKWQNGGKKHGVIVCAIAAKLARIIYRLMKDKVDYTPCTKLLKVHIAQSDHRPIPAKDYEGNY